MVKPPWPLFDRSQVAQYNDESRGHWLILDGFVYDVSELMRSAGPRILQLHAGCDATQSMRRGQHGAAQLSPLLAGARIGAVREPACITQRDHDSHSAAVRALCGALQRVVELQNLLRADQAFQPLAQAQQARGRGRAELQRGVETHGRFLGECVDVILELSSSTLPRALLTPEVARACGARLAELLSSAASSEARAGALVLLEQLADFTDSELSVRVACFEVLDSWLLRACKRDLTRALQTLERPHAAELQLPEAERVFSLCDRLVDRLGEYFRGACSVGR